MVNFSVLAAIPREWSIVLAVLVSVGSIVVFAIVAYLLFYIFAYKMMRKRTDWGKRAFFLVAVSLIGLAIRFVCILSSGALTSFQDFLTYSVKTIYATIGVFSFEGQENTGLYDFLYFYTTLWVAVTYVVVLFTGFNYSLQSRIALALPKRENTSFYIFTKVTDESYALAESIELKHRYYFHTPFRIIFASDEIDTFDAKNELHKKVRSAGYYFISIEKKAANKEKKPIIESLGISYKRLKYVRIFAMERDEFERGNEIRNSDIIFDDIECMVEKLANKKHALLLENVEENYINYFIYVANEVNSEFFEEMLKNRMPKNITPEEYDFKYKKFFRVKGFSEAQLCGQSLLFKRQEVECERIIKNKKLNAVTNDVHQSIVVGFGANGQASLKNLFLDSAGLCKDEVTNLGFEAHIFDKNIDAFSGIYEMNHPSIIFRHGHEFMKTDSGNINQEALEEAYQNNRMFKEMNFPIYNFYNIDCKGEGILEKLLKICLSEEKPIQSIIICMGNDESNIELANAFIKQLRQHIYADECYSKDKYQLDIYINLREENAEKRLVWSNNLEKAIHPGINVIPYGDYKNMFTYDNIISDEKWLTSNRAYATLSYILYGSEYTYRALIDQCDRYGEREDEVLEAAKNRSFMIENYTTSSYSRESSTYAYLFYAYYQAYFKAFEGCDKEQKQKIYDYLAKVEHVRWNRFTIISGFIYCKSASNTIYNEVIAKEQFYPKVGNARNRYNKESVKLHTDIVPTKLLTHDIFLFDYMNVIAARLAEKQEEDQ